MKAITDPMDAPNSPAQGLLVWNQTGASSVAVCPVCQAAGAKRMVLRTKSPQSGQITVLECDGCTNLFCEDLKPFHYEDTTGLAWATDFYVEQGAAVDALIEPIARLGANRVKRYLEIGCGYGFSIEIDLGGRFELVYASEVIEHVNDPQAFIEICTTHLAADGILVLTTPDAGSIRQETPVAELLLALSPGHHLILYSADGLSHLLRMAGFEHVSVASRGHRLIAYASRQPIDFDTTAPLDRTMYCRYLTQLLSRRDLPPSLERGLRHRLLKELTNAADYDAAQAVLALLASDIDRTYGFALDAVIPATVLDQIRSGAVTGRFGAPWCLAGILYCAGIIAQNGRNDPAAASLLFDQAARAAAAFRRAYVEIDIDEGETSAIEQDAPGQSLLSLCRVDPDATVARIEAAGNFPQAWITRIFACLADLGFFRAAARLEPLVHDRSGWRVANAVGLLEMLHHRRPAAAVDAFASAWDRALTAAPDQDGGERCRAKHHEVLARMVIGDGEGAATAAMDLLGDTAPAWVTDEARANLRALLADHPAVRSIMKALPGA